MTRHGLSNVLEEETMWFERIRFCESMPSSSIVMENKNGVDIMKMKEKEFKYHIEYKGYLLYQEFITVGSDLQVMLSVDVVDPLHRMVGNEDRFLFNNRIELHQLLFLFSPCCREIVRRLEESYIRFKRTAKYRKLLKFVFI